MLPISSPLDAQKDPNNDQNSFTSSGSSSGFGKILLHGVPLLMLIFYGLKISKVLPTSYWTFDLQSIKALSFFSSLFVPAHLFAFFIFYIFWKSFFPVAFKFHRLAKFLLFTSLSVTAALACFAAIVPEESPTPIFLSQLLVASVVGQAMRHQIWGECDALVIGFFWIRRLLVPSYVLLFFFFFYLFLSQLGLSEPYSEIPFPYFPSFTTFVFAFLISFFVKSTPSENHLA